MIPLHLRKKLRTEKPKPKHFEVMPPIGSLMPGQRINVQVKFMPTEEVRGCLKLFGGKLVVQVVRQWRSAVNFFYNQRRSRPHCTPKEFENWLHSENASNVFRRSTLRRRNLKTQQSQVILDLCAKKTRSAGEIIRLSRRHRFQEAQFLKCSLSTRKQKPGGYKIPTV